jgi:hypothetical protein
MPINRAEVTLLMQTCAVVPPYFSIPDIRERLLKKVTSHWFVGVFDDMARVHVAVGKNQYLV